MNKKTKIIIIVIAVIIVGIIFITTIMNKKSKQGQVQNQVQSEIKYDEKNLVYTMTDSNGNVHESPNKDDLYVYTIDPDYNSGNPDERGPYDYYDENEIN